MSIVIRDSSISDGVSDDALFLNDAGKLTISDLTVENTTAEEMIKTTNGGTSTLTDSVVTESSIQRVTETSSGASQRVERVNINNMQSMDSTFLAQGSGTSLVLVGTVVESNSPSSFWRGVEVLAGADARMTRESTFASNSNMQFGVITTGQSSTASVLDSFFTNNVGLSVSV